jgi:pimeloyl-ACP methyl ester carboxylesterase
MHITLPQGLRIEYERHGAGRDPVLLLINGLGQQLTAWPDDFVTGLVTQGWQVLCFDNRDVGLSSRCSQFSSALGHVALGSWLPQAMTAGYLLSDMARDALGLLDALAIEHAHVVGVSMGGMIAQMMAAHWPDRVRSLTSIMSSSGAHQHLWHWSPATQAMFTPPYRPDEGAILDHLEHVEQLIGSPTMKEPRPQRRARLLRQLRRAYDPAGVLRQLTAVLASGDRRPWLRHIRAPSLVIHGELDPVVPLAAGRDTAAHIPNAQFMSIPGMGHDLPCPLRPRLVDTISRHCAAAQPSV